MIPNPKSLINLKHLDLICRDFEKNRIEKVDVSND